MARVLTRQDCQSLSDGVMRRGSGHFPTPFLVPADEYIRITDPDPWGDNMWEVLKAIVVVVLSLAALLAFLGLLYWLTTLLPKRWQESWKAWVFLLPAMIAVLVGLLIPAIRTIYISFLDDNAKDFVGFDNYTDIFTTTGTRLTVFNSVVWVSVGTIDHRRGRARRRPLRRQHPR